MSQADIKALGRALVDWAETEAHLIFDIEWTKKSGHWHSGAVVYLADPLPWKRSQDTDA